MNLISIGQERYDIPERRDLRGLIALPDGVQPPGRSCGSSVC